MQPIHRPQGVVRVVVPQRFIHIPSRRQKCGDQPVLLTDRLDCEAREAGRFLAGIVRTHAGKGRPLAFLAGGDQRLPAGRGIRAGRPACDHVQRVSQHIAEHNAEHPGRRAGQGEPASFHAGEGGKIILIAVGKAAWAMAKAASEVLERIDSGLVITKYGHVGGESGPHLGDPERPSIRKGRKGEQMKVRSKFLALLLAMVMALGLIAPAAASEGAAPAAAAPCS